MTVPTHHKQRGVALITVMLVLALCMILVSEIMTKQGLQVKRIQNLTERQQAYWYAMGAEKFVRSLLEKTIDDDKGVINLSQDWATTDMAFPVDNGMIEGQLKDLQACLNLNGLHTPELQDKEKKARRDIFTRYLKEIEFDSLISKEDMINNVYDWIDKDDYAVEGIGYDGDMYTSMDFPYLAANTLMASASELRVIDGFNPLVMEEVQDVFCVIPNSDLFEVNVNTVSKENAMILAAMFDISQSDAESIIDARPEEGFEEINEFWQLPEMKFAEKKADLDKSQFTVKSKFFTLTTIAHYNDVAFPLTSTFQLTKENKMQVIARRIGGTLERKADPETE